MQRQGTRGTVPVGHRHKAQQRRTVEQQRAASRHGTHGAPAGTAVGRVLPGALAVIATICTYGDAGQGVAVDVREFSGQQAGHRGAGVVGRRVGRRGGLIFINGCQRRRTTRIGADRRIGHRGDGHGNVSGSRLRVTAGITQVVDNNGDGVGGGTGAVRIIMRRRVDEAGQRGIQIGDSAVDRETCSGTGAGGNSVAASCRIEKVGERAKCHAAMRDADGGRHSGAASIRVGKRDARGNGQRAVFGNCLCTRVGNGRRNIDADHRNRGGTDVADQTRRIGRLVAEGGIAEVVGDWLETQAGSLRWGQRHVGSDGRAASLQQPLFHTWNGDNLVTGDAGIGGVVRADAVGVAGVGGQVDGGRRTVLVDRQRKIAGHRRIVDRGHIKAQGFGCGVEHHAAIAGGTTVILDLKSEACVVSGVDTSAIEAWGVNQIARGDVGQTDFLGGMDCNAAELQGTITRQRSDLDREERVGRCVVRVGEPKVVRRQSDGRVFNGRQRGADAHRCISHRGNSDCESLCGDVSVIAHQITSFDRNRDGGGTGPVGIGNKTQRIQECVDVCLVALCGQ